MDAIYTAHSLIALTGRAKPALKILHKSSGIRPQLRVCILLAHIGALFVAIAPVAYLILAYRVSLGWFLYGAFAWAIGLAIKKIVWFALSPMLKGRSGHLFPWNAKVVAAGSGLWSGVAELSTTAALSDPLLNDPFYRSSSPGHFWHLSGAKEPFDYEKKIDELLNRAAFEFDFAKRKALASELQKIMAEELPIVPLLSRKAILAASEALGNVEAFTANAFGVQEFLAVVFRRR